MRSASKPCLISSRKAVTLVLLSVAMGQSGGVFVLDIWSRSSEVGRSGRLGTADAATMTPPSCMSVQGALRIREHGLAPR